MDSKYIIAIVVVLVLLVAAYYWYTSEMFQARGWSASQRSYHTGNQVGMTPTADQLKSNQFSGREFGVHPRTLHTSYPLADMNKRALGEITIPQLNMQGVMDQKL
jgi:hypothetical protein